MTIYATPVDPATREAAGPISDSGYTSFAELDEDFSVPMFYGALLVKGKRTRTFESMFFSDYSLTGSS